MPTDYQPRKVLVLVDESDSLYFKNLTAFNKTVLPLLTLAGMDVYMERAKTRADLTRLSATVDVQNSAGVLVLGSAKHSAPAVLNGLFNGGTEARIAFGVFDPGQSRCLFSSLK